MPRVSNRELTEKEIEAKKLRSQIKEAAKTIYFWLTSNVDKSLLSVETQAAVDLLDKEVYNKHRVRSVVQRPEKIAPWKLVYDFFKGKFESGVFEVSELDIFLAFRFDRIRTKMYLKQALDSVCPEERLWVVFDPNSGQSANTEDGAIPLGAFVIYGIGPEKPEGYLGPLPVPKIQNDLDFDVDSE